VWAYRRVLSGRLSPGGRGGGGNEKTTPKEAGGTERVEPVRLRESDRRRVRWERVFLGNGKKKGVPGRSAGGLAVAFQSTVLRIESLSHRR